MLTRVQAHRLSFLIPVVSFLLSGCGYSTRSLLPGHIKTIQVAPFKNKILYTTETTRNTYFPLLEVKIRDAVVDRFLFDGNLKIEDTDAADIVMKGELIGYQRDVLRYTDDNDVQEYRINISVALELWDSARGEILWKETNFVGETTYFVIGPSAKSENEAVEDAVTDLAQRIVSRTVEDW